MAVIHRAKLRPTKLELLSAWLPEQPWYPGPEGAPLAQLGAYRFDDPAGEVGVETLLLQVGDDAAVQVPLTYRGEPLVGAEQFLVGTTDHSVLGPRWVYDGCGDPVYAAVLAEAILAGAPQAEEFVDVDGESRRREPTSQVAGTGAGEVPVLADEVVVHPGDPTAIVVGEVELRVRRVVGKPVVGDELLTGTWAGQPEAVPLAAASRR